MRRKRERGEREKEEAKERRKKISCQKTMPAKTWKKFVWLNIDDICGHFRESSTVHPGNKIL